MSEHSQDDPVEREGSAGEQLADATVESEETGTRYAPDGSPESTPEDEWLLEEVDEEI